MKVSDRGIALIQHFEGFPEGGRPYWDALGRIWTRGYGRTRGIGPGSPRITEAQAIRELADMLRMEYLPAIERLPMAGSLNQNQVDAIASFVWNMGPGAIASSTGIGRALRARDWRLAATELLRWDKAGSPLRRREGLTRRRRAERALFLRTPEPEGPAAWLTPTELRRVRELDAIRGGVRPAHPGREASLVAVLTAARKRVWRVAQPKPRGGDGKGWGYAHREKRYTSMLARTR